MDQRGRATIELEHAFGAHNYNPLRIVADEGEGIFIWDTEGKCYIDLAGAYSAESHGYCHPRIVEAATQQLRKLGTTGRNIYTSPLGAFLKRACELTGQDRALPMNTGAEANETALKVARKWGYTVKGIPGDAEIIACEGNFHGRTIALVGLSSHEPYRCGFGPFPPGLVIIPYGDASALDRAITENTVAFLVEPIQGEGGIIIPPSGYLRECAAICKFHNVLFIADEVQTGLGRTGKLLACDHEGVKPDGLSLGKALGGGPLAVSLFLAKKEVMDVLTPGDHGSTFGGNPLAAAVGLEALNVMMDEHFIENSAVLGKYFLELLRGLKSPIIRDVRGRGLFIGVEICEEINARTICEELLKYGIIGNGVHEHVIRFSPPLIITRKWIDESFRRIARAFSRWSEWK